MNAAYQMSYTETLEAEREERERASAAAAEVQAKLGKRHPAYAIMIAFAGSQFGFFRDGGFSRDLTFHDAGVLARIDVKDPFVWFLSANGTHFAHVTRHPTALARRWLEAVADHCRENGYRAFFWDGRALAEKRPDEVRDLLIVQDSKTR